MRQLLRLGLVLMVLATLAPLAVLATYIHDSTGPIMARVEAERANPQGDVIWGLFNDYLTGAAQWGLLEPYVAQESEAIPARFKHPENQWQGVTLLTSAPGSRIPCPQRQ